MDFLLSNNNVFILAVAVVSGIMLMFPKLGKAGGSAAVGTLEATQLVNQRHAVLVDIRAEDAFAAGHIAQSRHIPLAELEQKAASLPKDKPLIVVCETGRSAVAAARKLRALGHETFVLDGGVRAWTQASMPLTKKK